MNNTRKIVPSKIAVKLTKIGFDEICEFSYSTSIEYNGRYIDFDTECELISEGHGKEIKYVPYKHLGKFWMKNGTYENAVAAPYIEQVVDWLFDKHRIYVYTILSVIKETPKYEYGWSVFVKYAGENGCLTLLELLLKPKQTKEESLLEGIDFALNYIKKKKK